MARGCRALAGTPRRGARDRGGARMFPFPQGYRGSRGMNRMARRDIVAIC